MGEARLAVAGAHRREGEVLRLHSLALMDAHKAHPGVGGIIEQLRPALHEQLLHAGVSVDRHHRKRREPRGAVVHALVLGQLLHPFGHRAPFQRLDGHVVGMGMGGQKRLYARQRNAQPRRGVKAAAVEVEQHVVVDHRARVHAEVPPAAGAGIGAVRARAPHARIALAAGGSEKKNLHLILPLRQWPVPAAPCPREWWECRTWRSSGAWCWHGRPRDRNVCRARRPRSS